MEMHRSLRERLADRWGDHPLLRLMLCSPSFAFVFLGLVAGALSLLLVLPPIIRATPSGFEPTVKLSLVELARIKSLKLSAARQARDEQWIEALRKWQAASRRNPADRSAWRGAFRILAERADLPRELAQRTLTQGPTWLLRLGGTNMADVELVAAAQDRFEQPDRVCALLDPLADRLSPRLEATYLKALFGMGRYPGTVVARARSAPGRARQ